MSDYHGVQTSPGDFVDYPLQGVDETHAFKRDYHAHDTITFGELVDYEGWDWGRDAWGLSFIDDTMTPPITTLMRRAVNTAIEQYYYQWELGDYPAQHGRNMVARLTRASEPFMRIMSRPVKELLKYGYTKSEERFVNSDYPASQIKTNGSDYATSATDHETLNTGEFSGEKIIQILQQLPLVSTLVDAVAPCFSPLIFTGRLTPNGQFHDYKRQDGTLW